VDLYFVPVDGTPGRWATDLRSAGISEATWSFAVETDIPDADVTVSWPDLSGLPRDRQLTLMDTDAGTACQMRTRSSYTFSSGPDAGQRRFRVELEPASANALAVGSVAVAASRGAGSSISYSLSRSAAVTVTIHNVAGRMVRAIVSSAQQARGPNSVLWDGRSDFGTVAPSGLYVCHIRAADSRGQKAQAVAGFAVHR
jgi:hypothetical protein